MEGHFPIEDASNNNLHEGFEASLKDGAGKKFPGSIFVEKRQHGYFIKWRPDEGYDVNSISKNCVQKLNFNIEDLASVQEDSSESKDSTKMTLILKCGSILPSLYLVTHTYEDFLSDIKEHTQLTRLQNHPGLHVVKYKRSFDEGLLDDLKLLANPWKNIVSHSTNFLKDGFNKLIDHREKVPSYQEDSGDDIGFTSNYDRGFELITAVEDLSKRPQVERGPPMTAQEWSALLDAKGKIISPSKVRQLIFRKGVEGSIRQEVWKFLLGLYPWDSTADSRLEQHKGKSDHYFRMKRQWEWFDDDQLSRFTSFRDMKCLIDKDVWRTDRNHPFFEGRNNPNLQVLQDILLTHCMYHFDLGYVQGMSDLLAPIQVIMEHEVDAFWTFAGLIKLVSHNFEQNQRSINNQFKQLRFLIETTDPKFAHYLDRHDSLNMFFCFRWLLLLFKRDFSFPDTMRLWEVLWTGLPCRNFHLLVCLSILDNFKLIFMENNFGLNEILKFVNDFSGKINVEDVLKAAECIYLQLSTCKRLSSTAQSILGLNEHDADTSSPFMAFNPYEEPWCNNKDSPSSSPNRGTSVDEVVASVPSDTKKEVDKKDSLPVEGIPPQETLDVSEPTSFSVLDTFL